MHAEHGIRQGCLQAWREWQAFRAAFFACVAAAIAAAAVAVVRLFPMLALA